MNAMNHPNPLPSSEAGAPSPLPSDRIPLARPGVLDPESVQAAVGDILLGGTLTNGRLVRELEDRVAGYLGVRHCVAVSSCTAGRA
jgi:dTDP-4-amino-4,6-dideoxygalactose transaminase